MNIKEFQEKLSGLLDLAGKNGNKISREMVEQYFKQEMMNPDQLEKVCEYLSSQKVQVSGGRSLQQEKSLQWEPDPLSDQEQAYVQNYKKSLPKAEVSEEQLRDMAGKSLAGDETARKQLIESFLPDVVEIACRLHEKHVSVADTISEGNMHLIMAVNRLDSCENPRAFVHRGIEDGIHSMIEEQLQQRRQDKSMVDKVRKLETAIKELTDGDDKLEFSVDELSIFLDMSREEIENILRLAGEDK